MRRLKQALDWAALTEVRVLQWRRAGKNVDGGPGLPWPVALYVPLLVFMWLQSYHARQMEEYLRESVGARRFLALQDAELEPLRDPSSIARAAAALGAEGKATGKAVVLKTAQQVQFTDGKLLSSDTTVEEPAIGYPNEPGILKGWAERIERGLKKLKRGGGKGLSGVGFLCGQKHLMSSSQCVTLNSLGPRLRDEAALWETTLIEQRHADDDPALAKDTDQPQAGCRSGTRPWAIAVRQGVKVNT